MTIEEYVISYLGGALEGVSVSGNIPHPMPARFVTVELTGSSMRNLIPTASLVIESWGTSRLDSAQLHEQVTEAMLAMTAGPDISRVRLVTGYNDADLATDRPRYNATFEVVYLF